MGVVVVVGDGKARGVLFHSVWRASEDSLACRMAPRLQLVWKRGPLAPSIVGEGAS